MKYTVNKPDGTPIHFRSNDALVMAYNSGDINAGWYVKAEDATQWSPVWELLGVPPPASSDATNSAAPADPGAGSTGVSEAVRTAAATRYRDAYRVAAATVTIGQALKVIAICLAGLCVIGAVAGVSQSLANLSSFNGGPVLMGLLAAVAVGVPFYALGILISALGQILRAVLDIAVHTSPFLDKDQMAQIIGRS